jgi:hypothetical protein
MYGENRFERFHPQGLSSKVAGTLIGLILGFGLSCLRTGTAIHLMRISMSITCPSTPAPGRLFGGYAAAVLTFLATITGAAPFALACSAPAVRVTGTT